MEGASRVHPVFAVPYLDLRFFRPVQQTVKRSDETHEFCKHPLLFRLYVTQTLTCIAFFFAAHRSVIRFCVWTL